MKTQLLEIWDRLRSSFWFVPALMTAGAVLLASASVALDRATTDEWLDGLRWVYSGGAEGASAVLGTIAGSMMTIAGVVFSMTLVALSLASSQLGPRLLRNFMRDTGNQVVLGTFIATFLYCLLVLRTIRREDEVAFVPHLAVTIGVVLAVASVIVLIYFIHHISVSIQADHIVARVGRELIAGIDEMFPHRLEAGVPQTPTQRPPAALLETINREGSPAGAPADGYVQSLDEEGLLALAGAAGVVLQVERGPGSYAVAGRPLARVWPAGRLSAELAEQIRDAFVLGGERTPAQDLLFTVDQLVEIAVRALSPGVNDPFTALRCVDRLGSALCCLAQRATPSPYRYDEAHQLRLVVPVLTFPQMAGAAFDPIRNYAGSSAAVTIRLLETIAEIAGCVCRPEDRAALQRHATMITRGAHEGLLEREDRRAVDVSYAAASQAINGSEERGSGIGDQGSVGERPASKSSRRSA
jgi:uncharacterized membrane protein